MDFKIQAFTIVDFYFVNNLFDRFDRKRNAGHYFFVPQWKSSELRQQLNEKLCSAEKMWVVSLYHIFHILSFKYYSMQINSMSMQTRSIETKEKLKDLIKIFSFSKCKYILFIWSDSELFTQSIPLLLKALWRPLDF